MSHLRPLAARGIAKPPRWLADNLHYETLTGSSAYGVAADESDWDITGFAVPPRDDLFPHLRGEIPGFGHQSARFEQYQEHHLRDPDALGGRGRSYDFAIFSIVKYFQLAMENNPNIIDSLFTPADVVLHQTRVGALVRERRALFLHKGAWPKFKGYAYAQLHKLTNKAPTGKRAELVTKHGYDTKYAYHIVRLLGEVEQILTEGDIDLRRNAEQLKSVRRGEWSEAELRGWASAKERDLERAFAASNLRAVPDESAIRRLLLDCLEDHYGTLSGAVVEPDRAVAALRAVAAELERVRDLV